MEGLKKRLLTGCEVTLARADLKIFLQGADLDAAVASVGVKVRGCVRTTVLRTQLIFNGREGVRNVFHLEGEERASSGGGGNFIEYTVAAEDKAAVVG